MEINRDKKSRDQMVITDPQTLFLAVTANVMNIGNMVRLYRGTL